MKRLRRAFLASPCARPRPPGEVIPYDRPERSFHTRTGVLGVLGAPARLQRPLALRAQLTSDVFPRRRPAMWVWPGVAGETFPIPSCPLRAFPCPPLPRASPASIVLTGRTVRTISDHDTGRTTTPLQPAWPSLGRVGCACSGHPIPPRVPASSARLRV